MKRTLQQLVDTLGLDREPPSSPIRRAVDALRRVEPMLNTLTPSEAAVLVAKFLGPSSTQFERGVAFGTAITLTAIAAE